VEAIVPKLLSVSDFFMELSKSRSTTDPA
jgi:hypothetical protein